MNNRLVFLALAVFMSQTAIVAQDQGLIKLSLTPNRPPVPALAFALLPDLREQVPGNATVFYRQVADLMGKIPADQSERNGLQTLMDRWADMPLAQLPRDEMRKVLDLFKEPLKLLEKATHAEFCNWNLAQRIREAGISTMIEEMQKMRMASRLFFVKARLELAEDRPDLALRTLRCSFTLSKNVGEAPTLITQLIGVAIATRNCMILEQVLAHPRTPNLYWALASLPQPFLDPRKPFEGEKLGIYGTFAGTLDLAIDPEAGPLPPEKIEKMIKFYLTFEPNTIPETARRVLLAATIRARHETAKKALIAAGRSPGKIEQWPHAQVAMMHALGECDQLLDDIFKWQSFPYWQAAPALEQIEQRVRASRTRGRDAPAIGLAPLLLPATKKVILARNRLERRFGALRCLEAVRLYAAEHKGQLPATLAEIKDLPLPVCPITGKPFEYRRTGDGTAVLSAPPAPKESAPIKPLSYELTLRR